MKLRFLHFIAVLTLLSSLASCSNKDVPLMAGKWECSPDLGHGWTIEYRPDGRYVVTFKSGKQPWTGRYYQKKHKDYSEIVYAPDNLSENDSKYLPGIFEINESSGGTAKRGTFRPDRGAAPQFCELQ